ncbi:MAG: hypothetical protein AAF600_13905 [Bacteroidota bacterium]
MAKKRIFPENLSLDALNSMEVGGVVAPLGIHFIESGSNYLKATMPIDHKT